MNIKNTPTLQDLIDQKHGADSLVTNYDLFVYECAEKNLKPTYNLFSLWMEMFHSGVE